MSNGLRIAVDEGVQINVGAMTAMAEAHRAEHAQADDYPARGTTESQITTLTINKKEAKITPSTAHYGIFAITYGDKSYTLILSCICKITKEFVICLAKHAIRLKKNITFVSHKSEIIGREREDSENEILIVRFDTEHYSAKVTRIRHLELPGTKVKLEDIENNIGRRMRLFALPENKEFIGCEFKDLRNNPIAYMSNTYGAILLLWNILSYRECPTKNHPIYLDYILTNYSAKCDEIKAKAKERIEQEREERRKVEYTSFIETMFQESVFALENRVHATQTDIDAHMRGLYAKGQELVKDGDFLQKLKDRSTSKKIKDQLETDYKLITKLRKANKYTNFRFDAGSIVGRTSMIKFFNKYEVGLFDVYLSLNGVVKCHNKTYICEGAYDHPHVSHGNPCWGNLGEAVFKMLRSNQFGAAFDIMYEFLIRYNDGRGEDSRGKPYRRLEDWNPAFRQQGLAICRHCERIKELCRCARDGERVAGRCGHCNVPYENCQCARCPAEGIPNNIIGVHIDCNGDCEHYDSDSESCGY